MWESRQGRPFRGTPTSVVLGAGEAYLGHGLMLQPQLEANPLMLASASVSAGVPYLLTTKLVGEGESSLINTWGLHPIRL